MSTAPTVADLNPKTLEHAKRQFVELYGSALVMNTYLKVALVLVSLVALGLVALNARTATRAAHLKPLVIRIDDLGRAEAVSYDAATYHPQAPEMRYFLTQFVEKYFSRIRSTIQREYPNALLFLSPALAEATMARDEQQHTIEQFVTNPSADEVDVVVQNVSLSDVTKPPYTASVTFQQVFYAPGMGTVQRRENNVAQIEFRFRDQVPNALVPVNPLGLEVTYFRVDQAFEASQP
jgi:type IV secretion system protein VirB5